MNADSVIVYAKLFCIFGGTSLLCLQTGLSQWSNETATPSKVQWIMILGGSLGAGLMATGGFLSNDYGNYRKSQNDINSNRRMSLVIRKKRDMEKS
jgi:hypothetical protein